MVFYKALHSRNWRYCISVGTFPKSAKGTKPYKTYDKVYHSGIHFHKSSDNLLHIFIVMYLVRVIISFPVGPEIGECCN